MSSPALLRTALALGALGAVLAGLLFSPAPSGARAPQSHAVAAEISTAPSWSVDLTASTADQSNIARTDHGLTVHDPHTRPAALPADESYAEYTAPQTALGRTVTTLTVDTTATHPAHSQVDTEVRGQDRPGAWTQWRTVTDRRVAFPSPVSVVQVRLVLTAAADGDAPTVSKVQLSAAGPDPAAGPGAPAQATDVTFRVYATREGLVGDTTANGHVVTDHDHFAALPSRRMLASKAGNEYQVRICYQSRCETAAVWDVGPWNTRDDYWNPSDVRQSWTDLPQGTPEAQAANRNGYNNGLDQFGRHVRNPAGIDLADGTFWDGLGMSDNDWVDVTFQPTDGGTTTVTAWTDADVRSCATLSCDIVGEVTAGNTYPAGCWTVGDSVTDAGLTDDKWVRLLLNAGGDGYVNALALQGDETGGVPNRC